MCFFDAAHWGAHEHEKKNSMLHYTSPIESLLKQLGALRPSSMACPPNIWAGLFARYREELAVLKVRGYVGGVGGGEFDARALQRTAALLGGRMTNMATGGAPTLAKHLRFAKALCRHACSTQGKGATFVESCAFTHPHLFLSTCPRAPPSTLAPANCTHRR